MKHREEEWGTALGSDPYKPKEPPTTTKRNSVAGLVRDFHDSVLMVSPMKLNAQSNGPALSKAFSKMLAEGLSYDHIRQMISQFRRDITNKPLSDGIPAWRAFLSRLDSLSAKVQNTHPSYNYEGPKVDPRLNVESND